MLDKCLNGKIVLENSLLQQLLKRLEKQFRKYGLGKKRVVNRNQHLKLGN